LSESFDFACPLVLVGYFSVLFAGRKGVILVKAEFHLILYLLVVFRFFEQVGGRLFLVGLGEFIEPTHFVGVDEVVGVVGLVGFDQGAVGQVEGEPGFGGLVVPELIQYVSEFGVLVTVLAHGYCLF
jgi:hypothetical protein